MIEDKCGLQEFYDFTCATDAAVGRVTSDLPYALDGDRVGQLPIKLMFSKDSTWTKALKYMLTDLKWCLSWVVDQQGGPSLPQVPADPEDLQNRTPVRTAGPGLAPTSTRPATSGAPLGRSRVM